MSTQTLHFTAAQLVRRFQTKTQSPSSYLETLFAHIEAQNPRLNALTSLQKEKARERARLLEQTPPTADQFLYGVPVVIKENIQKIGYPLECASRILKGYKGQYTASAVEELEKAGAIIIATANMDEFAMGSGNEHSVHGPVQNPHDYSRVSGGSSGGSAAACAALFAPLTLGSETGGSVREPASFCGIYGFKPSYGRVSRFGLVAYGSSLDQISPFARSAEDIDLAMRAMGVCDPRDATSRTDAYISMLGKERIAGKKIGIIRSLLKEGVNQDILRAHKDLEDKLVSLGAQCVDIEVSYLEHSLSVYYLIACAEASSNLARFDGIRYGHRAEGELDLLDLYCKSRSEGFGKEVKKRILLGTFALSAGYYDAFYGRAQQVRTWIAAEFEKAFQKVDFLFLPTAPNVAFAHGANADPLEEYLYDIFTIPANLAGIPAISVPAPVASGSLPIGMQFLAKRGEDASLVAFAHALEEQGLVGTTALSKNEVKA